MLGKTHSLFPLIDFIDSMTRKASLLNGTLCGFFIFINSAGMFHIELSVSISAHLVRTASPGRTQVSNCHSISNRVSIRTEAFFNTVRKRGSSVGGRAGMFCFFGLLNLWARLSAGLNSISSSVAAQRKISFSRDMMRRSVSRTPRFYMGSKCCLSILGRISLIGVSPNVEKIFLSRLRQMSLA